MTLKTAGYRALEQLTWSLLLAFNSAKSMSALWQQTVFMGVSWNKNTEKESNLLLQRWLQKKGHWEDSVSSDLVSFLQWTIWRQASSGGRSRKIVSPPSKHIVLLHFHLKWTGHVHWSVDVWQKQNVSMTLSQYNSISVQCKPTSWEHQSLLAELKVEVFTLAVFNCNILVQYFGAIVQVKERQLRI